LDTIVRYTFIFHNKRCRADHIAVQDYSELGIGHDLIPWTVFIGYEMLSQVYHGFMLAIEANDISDRCGS